MSNLLFVAGIIIILSTFASKIGTRFGIPVLLIFMGIGIIAGSDGLELISLADQELTRTIANIALMFILFDSGFNTKKQHLEAHAGPSLTLATLGIVVTAVALGVLVHFLLHQDWLFSFMIGAIISSTDAAAVMTVLRERPIVKRISSTLEIESAANDPMAILLTLFMINLVLNAGEASAGDYVFFVVKLVWQFVGGILVALACSKLAVWLYNHFKSENQGLFYVLYIGIVFATYGAADLVQANGVIAIFFTGYWMGNSTFVFQRGVSHFVSALSSFANMCVFLLLGLLVAPHSMVNVWREGIVLAAALILVARPIAVWICLLPFKFRRRERLFIAWGGLKGAVPVVLATYPAAYGLDPDGFVFNIVFFVVTFSCLIQGTTLAPFAKRLRFSVPKQSESPYSMELFSLDKTDFDVQCVPVTSKMPWLGKRIAELGLPEDIVISSMVRDRKIISPRGNTMVKEGDTLFILGKPSRVQEAVQVK